MNLEQVARAKSLGDARKKLMGMLVPQTNGKSVAPWELSTTHDSGSQEYREVHGIVPHEFVEVYVRSQIVAVERELMALGVSVEP